MITGITKKDVHGVIDYLYVPLDISLDVAALAPPWVIKVSSNKKARNTLLIMGAAGIAVEFFP